MADRYGYDVLSEVAPRTARNLRALKLAAGFVRDNPATTALIPASFLLPGSTLGLLTGAGLGAGAQVIDKSHPLTDEPSDWEAKTGAENMEDMLNGLAWHGAAAATAPGARLLAKGLAPVATRVVGDELPSVARGFVGPSAKADATMATGFVAPTPKPSALTPLERNQEVIGRLRRVPGDPAPEPVKDIDLSWLLDKGVPKAKVPAKPVPRDLNLDDLLDAAAFAEAAKGKLPGYNPKGFKLKYELPRGYGDDGLLRQVQPPVLDPNWRVPTRSSAQPARLLDPAFLR